MNFFVLIAGILLLIMAFINMLHFILRRKESKSDVQIYFIILFIFFMLMGFNNIMIGASEIKYQWVSFGISTGLVFFLLAAGMGLVQKIRVSKILGIVGLIYSGLFISLGQSHIFDNLEIGKTSILINNIISSLLTIIALFILGFYLYKTRLSPLFGLFFGVLIPTIQFLIIIILDVELNDALNASLIFFVNVFMYLGFKGKLSFLEKK